MKALLICPADRPGVARLADNCPLAIAPLLGKSVLEYWIETHAARGVKQLIVLATDRPDHVRHVVGDGARWGVQLELVPQSREFSVAEARARYRANDLGEWARQDDVVLMDYLPGLPERPLFESYTGWWNAVLAWMPHAVTPARIGAREVQPGVWVGLHSQVDPSARLEAPCWIGENVLIGPGATIGPNAIVDDRVIVENGARIENSMIWPETFVGRLVAVRNSLASGSTLLNHQTASCLRVPDDFLLGPLDARRFETHATRLPGRVLAFATLIATAPLAAAVMMISLLRGESPLQLRLGVRAQRGLRGRAHDTFAYYELNGAGNWLRRWPQFWSVVRGDLAWVGNRPLRPTQAFGLVNDFERLWLACPPGLISLADAHGCPEGVSADACAHASYYAVNANWRLDAAIVARAMARAAMAWPIYLARRRDAGAALPQLIPGREG